MLLLVPTLWLIFGNRSRRVTLENFEKIQDGMTVAQVNDLLGAKNRSKYAGIHDSWEIVGYSDDNGDWLIPGDGIRVGFESIDGDLRVVSKEFFPNTWEYGVARLRYRIQRRFGR
jgi:hypothetical protein